MLKQKLFYLFLFTVSLLAIRLSCFNKLELSAARSPSCRPTNSTCEKNQIWWYGDAI